MLLGGDKRATGNGGTKSTSPKVLRKLSAPAPSSGETIDGVATVKHAGSSSLGEFGDAALHDDPAIAAQLREWRDLPQVSWQLWVGPDRLPRRVHLTSTYPVAEDKRHKDAVIEVDFTGWGSDVRIDLPPSDQVHETGNCLDPEPH